MFYNKEFLKAKVAAKRVKYHRFATGRSTAVGALGSVGVNCDCSSGKIERGIGLDDYGGTEAVSLVVNNLLDMPAEFGVLKYETDDGEEKNCLIYVSIMNKLYVYNETSKKFGAVAQAFAAKPMILPWTTADGVRQLAFFSSNGVWSYDKENGLQLQKSMTLGSQACVFHDRAFVVKKPYTVYFCSPLDLGEWSGDSDQGGYIDLPADEGEIVGIVPLKEAVYIFRTDNILRLTAKGSARDFVVERCGFGGGKILENSAENCGENIFFLAEDGAYVFDGNESERVCQEMDISPLRGGQVCEHGFTDGKYLVRYTDTSGEKKMLAIDAMTQKGYFSFSDVVGLSNVCDGVMCYSDSAIKIFTPKGSLPKGEEAVFKAQNVDFGVRGRKLIRKIRLRGSGGGVLQLNNGETSLSISFAFKDGMADIPLVFKGEIFDLSITLNEECCISDMEIDMDVFG